MAGSSSTEGIEAAAVAAVGSRAEERVEAARRPAARPKHIPALDGLRGIAVLTVLLYHYGGGATSQMAVVRGAATILKLGWSGVTLFFVLSGFLITGILWDSKGQPHWWRNFYMRRTLRIFPLYYGTLLLIVAVGVWQRDWHGLKYVLVPVFYLQNIPPLYKLVEKIPGSFTLYHYWSLAVEEQFYLVWPALLLLVRTRRRAEWMCVGVFAGSILFRMWVRTTAWGPAWELLPCRAGELAAGAWLAFVYRSACWERIRRWMLPMAVVCAALTLVSGWLAGGFELGTNPMMMVTLVAITMCYAALVGAALEPGWIQRMASAGWLRWMGKISFGVYVFHIYFVHQFNAMARTLVVPGHRTLYLLTRMAVATVCSMVLAWISFRFYETPFLRWKSRYAARVAPAAERLR